MIVSSAYNLTSGDVAADTAQFQSFLNACVGDVGVLADGTAPYVFGAHEVPAGARVMGAGAVVKMASSVASSVPLCRIRSGTLLDRLTYEGLGSATPRASELITVSGETDVNILNCNIRDNAYIGLALGNTRGSRVVGCDFSKCGKQEVTAEGGPALWMGMGSSEILVEGNNIHDNEWAAIYATGIGLQIVNNRMTRCKEAGVFGNAQSSLVANNKISDIQSKYISGSGIELGATYVTIIGNLINNTADSSISLTDSQCVTVAGNVFANPRRQSSPFTRASGVRLLSEGAQGAQVMWVNVSGNILTGFSPAPFAFCTIEGAGAAAAYVMVQGNNAAGITFATLPAGFTQVGISRYQNGKLGAGCVLQ